MKLRSRNTPQAAVSFPEGDQRVPASVNLKFSLPVSGSAFARITVAAFAAQLDPTIEELADIKTAVSEAVTNSIIHGYENTEGKIKIIAKIFANTIEVEISDSGKGIDNVEMARKPLYTSKPNLERSGMGFTIMESFMDEVHIESVLGLGTKVTMKKVIEKQEKFEEEEKELVSLAQKNMKITRKMERQA